MISQATYIARFNAIIDRIASSPACHDQANWHCGTAHCLAGHAQIDSGKEADNANVRKDARVWLGITSIAAANHLFSRYRTLADFKNYCEGVPIDEYAADKYDRDGYNVDDGYADDEYADDGFDCNGFDCNGYARDGYADDGFDCNGYDREGFDDDGLNAQLESRPE